MQRSWKVRQTRGGELRQRRGAAAVSSVPSCAVFSGAHVLQANYRALSLGAAPAPSSPGDGPLCRRARENHGPGQGGSHPASHCRHAGIVRRHVLPRAHTGAGTRRSGRARPTHGVCLPRPLGAFPRDGRRRSRQPLRRRGRVSLCLARAFASLRCPVIHISHGSWASGA